jgi:hypothetical protein
MDWNENDLEQMASRGQNPETVEKQLEIFRRRIPELSITEPCSISNRGIIRFSEEECLGFEQSYISSINGLSVEKFVPASGAASRMFKHLYAHLEDQPSPESKIFFDELNKFAFGDSLKSGDPTPSGQKAIINHLLFEHGLNYGSLPKGMVLFHKYDSHHRTAFEEHLSEALEYGAGNKETAQVHFTVPVDHQEAINRLVTQCISKLEEPVSVRYSVQQPSTDIIAVTAQNEPFRTNDDELLFRPAGHGALISNLGDVRADIVFIKNIDNVVPAYHRNTTTKWKKALGGYLLELKDRVHSILRAIENVQETQHEEISEVLALLYPGLDISSSDSDLIFSLLNRPIRICGMVRSEGDPGGGPFWVKDSEGLVSRQIVETAQIKEHQLGLIAGATHFNPVDIVCCLRDFRGNDFDLSQFVDENTYFISSKTFEGRSLKALERPGLWNGAMARWNTVFVEVPAETFNPVKTVNDLLRPLHQPV